MPPSQRLLPRFSPQQLNGIGTVPTLDFMYSTTLLSLLEQPILYEAQADRVQDDQGGSNHVINPRHLFLSRC